MKKRNKKEIIHYLATKYNMPLQTIDRIVSHQFKYVSQIIKNGNFDSIRLPYFGKFSVNPNRVKYLTELKNKKDHLNGIPKKIDYDAYMVIRNQEQQLYNHESALLKYAMIYESKKKHTDDEKVLYKYCMQFPTIVESLKQIKEEEKNEEVKV